LQAARREDDALTSSRPLEGRRTRRSFELSKKRVEHSESVSSKTEPTERAKSRE
jgi:hypothetical protein